METELQYYDVFPRVVRENRKTRITIRPRGLHAAFTEAEYVVMPIPMDRQVDRPGDGPHRIEKLDVPLIPVRPVDGALSFEHVFEGEQMYSLAVRPGSMEMQPVVECSVYCLKDDWCGLLPYKMETHCHTDRSDGLESPSFVPPYYRELGYEALSITDHHKYEPSLEAIQAFKGLDTHFKLYPGEEVHAPGNLVHIVNFAGSCSVNTWIRGNPETYQAQVQEIMAGEKIPASIGIRQIASCIWVSRKIRETGGLSVMAHPHWRPLQNGAKINYSISTEAFLFLLENHVFDAWEIFGFSPERNNTHMALYLEAMQKGIGIPVLGANDSHGVAGNLQWFDKAYTVVLAEENTKEALISGIKKGLCAAVEQQDGTPGRVIGNPRMMRFTRFLLDSFYPLYQLHCRNEGMLMKQYVAGVPGAGEAYKVMAGHAEMFKRQFFHGTGFHY
ncbi:MAG: PHP domain-containing protein [Clostridia bacterium]